MSSEFELPPLPDHPEPEHMRWSTLEVRAISEYGRQCAEARAAPLLARIAELEGERERIARRCDGRAGMIDGLREYLRDFEGDRERLRAALAEKSATLEAVRADAERWQWRKSNPTALLVYAGDEWRVESVDDLRWHKTADDAVDAAIEARAAQAPLGAQATGNAQQTAEAIPVHCRERQRMAGKPYPRSGCEVCGKWSPRAKECVAALTEQNAQGGEG